MRAVVDDLVATDSDGPDWSGIAVRLEGPERALRRALHRWHTDAPEHRAHIGFSPVPGRIDLVVAWKDSHAPTGALARHLLRCQVDHEPDTPPDDFGELQGEAIGELLGGLGADIDLDAWMGEDAAHLLRGCGWLKARVALVRDAVVGRARARKVLELVGDDAPEKEEDGPVTVVVTRTSGVELVAELELRGIDLEKIGRVYEPWTREETTTWQAADAGRLRRVWNELVAEGFFLDRRGKRVDLGGQTGFIDLSLAAK